MLDANIILAKPNIGQRLLGRGGKKKMMASVVTADEGNQFVGQDSFGIGSVVLVPDDA